LNKSGAQVLQNNILGMINSNTADRVIPVNNYMGNDYTVQEAEIIVTMKNGMIVDIECLTEIQYNPTGGEYTEYNVTLTNTIHLAVNENLDEAQEYEAPSKGDGFLTHLKSIL
jgi:hypothetical protein